MASHWQSSGNRFTRRVMLGCALALAPQAAPAFDHVVEGAKGDRVTISLAAPSPLSDDLIRHATVTLCLFDSTQDPRAKAFDIRSTAPPRFWTNNNAIPACAPISDRAHNVSFFTTSGLPAFGAITHREVLRTRLDLGGLSGRRVDLIWTFAAP